MDWQALFLWKWKNWLTFSGNWKRNFRLRKVYLKLIQIYKIRLTLKLHLTTLYTTKCQNHYNDKYTRTTCSITHVYNPEPGTATKPRGLLIQQMDEGWFWKSNCTRGLNVAQISWHQFRKKLNQENYSIGNKNWASGWEIVKLPSVPQQEFGDLTICIESGDLSPPKFCYNISATSSPVLCSNFII